VVRFFLPYAPTAIATTVPVLAGLGVLMALASRDGTILDRRRHDYTSPAWLLLGTLVFFILRTVKVGPGRLAPLFVNVALWLALVWLVAVTVLRQQNLL
jgi:hypothetical protein